MDILIGKLLTMNMLAIAVGMDAFSLGFSIGMMRMRIREILMISILIGFFHILMPLIGMAAGNLLSKLIGQIAHLLGGIVLVFIGAQMFFSSWVREREDRSSMVDSFYKAFFLALGVSLDALSIGLSLGLFSIRSWLMLGLFGLWGAVLPLGGLLLGRQISLRSGWLHRYGERAGGLIMVLIGLNILF